ncbi:MAG: hypothetical protein BGO98_46900 [Myxococcales bacterium 68-20]|nr:MAG: hypothetical protein BGO98_46900 [Myxococcales bacterium 68-20]
MLVAGALSQRGSEQSPSIHSTFVSFQQTDWAPRTMLVQQGLGSPSRRPCGSTGMGAAENVARA